MITFNPRMLTRIRGFSLVELMVALAIGLFLIAGVFKAYVNGRASQDVVDEQVDMVANARFALETISADIRQAGVFGRVTDTFRVDTTTTMPAVPTECAAGWTVNVSQPIMAFNETDPYAAPCVSNYFQGDFLELRGTMRDPVAPLANDRIYINSDVNNAQFFYGTATPNISTAARNYDYYVSAYYIARDSDSAGDNIPSLHRITLQPGGLVVDQLLLAGVENFQVQIGLANDDNDDGVTDRISYVDPQNVVDWSAAKSVQVWLIVRSAAQSQSRMGTDTTINTNIAGQVVALSDEVSFAAPGGANDGMRRIVVSTVANLREL